MNPNYTFLIILVLMMGLMFFTQRSQKKQAQKRMESLNKLQKGYEVLTIGADFLCLWALCSRASLGDALVTLSLSALSARWRPAIPR